MTGEEMLAEIDRREYYREREMKNIELIDCMVYAGKLLFIAGCLLSIYGNMHRLWDALAGCF